MPRNINTADSEIELDNTLSKLLVNRSCIDAIEALSAANSAQISQRLINTNQISSMVLKRFNYYLT